MAENFPIDAKLEERISRAASAAGISRSDFIRRAIERACADELSESESLYDRIADLVGVVSHESLRDPSTHEAFGAIVEAKHRRRRA